MHSVYVERRLLLDNWGQMDYGMWRTSTDASKNTATVYTERERERTNGNINVSVDYITTLLGNINTYQEFPLKQGERKAGMQSEKQNGTQRRCDWHEYSRLRTRPRPGSNTVLF